MEGMREGGGRKPWLGCWSFYFSPFFLPVHGGVVEETGNREYSLPFVPRLLLWGFEVVVNEGGQEGVWREFAPCCLIYHH